MPLSLISTPRSLHARVGQEIAVTGWFRVEQDRIQRFAEVTDDLQWIHLDRERAARESLYGTTIAHGMLTLSLLPHFMNDAIAIEAESRMVVNYGFNRVRFPAPVRSGAALRGRFAVQSVKEMADAVEVVYTVTVENESSVAAENESSVVVENESSVVVESESAGKPCCIAEWVLRYYA